MYPTKIPIIPKSPDIVFGAGIGSFRNAKIAPKEIPVVKDKIIVFILYKPLIYILFCISIP